MTGAAVDTARFKLDTLVEEADYVKDVLAVAEDNNAQYYLQYRVGEDSVSFFIDVTGWFVPVPRNVHAGRDQEPVFPDQVQDLIDACGDAAFALGRTSFLGFMLFVARARNLRPLSRFMGSDEEGLRDLPELNALFTAMPPADPLLNSTAQWQPQPRHYRVNPPPAG